MIIFPISAIMISEKHGIERNAHPLCHEKEKEGTFGVSEELGMKRKGTFLRKITAFGVSVLMTASLMLSTGCDSRKELVVYNWGEYFEEEIIAKFEKAYPKYKLVYRTFENNEAMYPNLDNSYDVIVPSEYMVGRLIREGRLRKLDWEKLPNVNTYMDPLFENVQYTQDPEISDVMLQYGVPYLYCTVGLIYDANRVDLPEDTTDPEIIWGVLFDERYKRKIGMYDSMRETIGVALNYLGYSVNSLDPQELSKARQLLLDQKSRLSPIFGVDAIKNMIFYGDLVAAVGWSGDYKVLCDRIKEQNRSAYMDLRFVLPEGSNWSVDMMCIPTNARNVEGAHDFINFMYDPNIALISCESVGYSTPNIAAKEMLDKKFSADPRFYPTVDTLSRLEIYYTSEDYESKYNELWNQIRTPATSGGQ